MAAKKPKIVFFGVGAIGGSVGGWVAPHYDNFYFYDKGETLAALKANGLTTYLEHHSDQKETVKVKVIDSLDSAKDADVIVLGVKNYDLAGVAKQIFEKVGDRPLIVSMANGIENQRVLPQYFSRIIYCVVSYNAWADAPGVVGYQKRGPLILGTLKNDLQDEMKMIAELWNRGVETVITPHIDDAIHCKIVINLINAVTTLVGHGFRPLNDIELYQKIITTLMLEGVDAVKAAGYTECKLGGMPTWRKIWVGVKLPQFISGPIFKAGLKKMNISSMAQDVLVNKRTKNELDTINGRILELADKFKVPAPFNHAVFEISKAEFSQPGFSPMTVKELWDRIQKKTANK